MSIFCHDANCDCKSMFGFSSEEILAFERAKQRELKNARKVTKWLEKYLEEGMSVSSVSFPGDGTVHVLFSITAYSDRYGPTSLLASFSNSLFNLGVEDRVEV